MTITLTVIDPESGRKTKACSYGDESKQGPDKY